MSYERSASRIKAVDPDGNEGVVILAVDTLEAMAVPYVPDGGTLQKDYDGYAWFEPPTFRYKLNLEWDYERINADNNTFQRVKDLIDTYFSVTGDSVLDFYIKYENGTYDGNYVLPKMIPQIEEDTAAVMFENRARQKPRSITLESQSRSYTWDDVKFLYD